jgi:fumarate hydratase class II
MFMKKNQRTEKDSLGPVYVAADAFWGAQTQRALDNFKISGLTPTHEYIWAIGAIKFSAAEVNASLGLLHNDIALAIKEAAREVMDGKWDSHFVVDPFQAGAGTSHHMNANEVIANRATQILGGSLGEYRVHPNDHVNMSQSTNDVIPTAIRLGCLRQMPHLLAGIQSFTDALSQKAEEFDEVIKSGRTHLQDAVPIRLGQEFHAYALAVLLDKERIQKASGGLHMLGIGGSAVGTGLNVHPQYHQKMISSLTDLTGFSLLPAPDLIERMQSMADFIDFSGALRTLAVTVSRIANDLRLLSSGPATGLNEIILPAVQPGSSIMPGKVNPVIAEMVNMTMYQIMGDDTTIMLASQAGQLELNVMMPVIAHNLFEMVRIMTSALQTFSTRCIQGIQSNPQKAHHWLMNNAAIVTALNPIIGYSAGASLAKEALQSGSTLKELAIKKAQDGKLLHIHENRPATAVEIEQALADLRRLTQGGLPPHEP